MSALRLPIAFIYELLNSKHTMNTKRTIFDNPVNATIPFHDESEFGTNKSCLAK